jgi:zinc transport system ATP-binding protein
MNIAVAIPAVAAASARPATLELDSLICRFGTMVAVNGVSLQVQPGEHVAITGANGSGKSTLLRAILGFHADVAGRISIDGEIAVSSEQWRNRRERVAWMPQRQAKGRFPLLVRELLESSGNSEVATEAAHRLGIGQLLERPLHTLSGGQLQRSFLSRALGAVASRAGLLLADEPTAALDFEGQRAVAEVLAALPVSLLVVTHDRAVAVRCDRVLEMAGGQLREVRS